MRGADDHALAAGGLDPSGRGAPAGEDQRMDVMTLDDGELEIAIVRRTRNRFPDGEVAHRCRIPATAARRWL